MPAQFPGPGSLLTRVVALIRNWAGYYANAVAYDDLSRLSSTIVD